MNHRISSDDREFARSFHAGAVTASDFGHRSHLRLAYIELCTKPESAAIAAFKASLLRFLDHQGLGQGKYHETLTCAWVMAVAYFMRKSTSPLPSAAAFTSRNPELMESGIMLTHYSPDVLFSKVARHRFVEPDIQSIPSAVARARSAFNT